jgi:type IV secretory pathway VirB10-like protein
MSTPESEFSPQVLQKAGVRRVNSRPLIIAGVILAVFALLIAIAAIERGQQATARKEDDHGGTALTDAQNIPGMGQTYVPASVKATPTATPPPVIQSAPLPQPQATPDEDSLRRKREREEAFEQALKAKTALDINGGGVPLSPQVQRQSDLSLVKADPNNLGGLSPDALVQYRQQAALAQQMINPNGSQPPESPNDLSAFNAERDRWKLASKVEQPATPYTLRTGYVIPAILISAMDSELPGTITAQVAQNVYDTPTGNYILIPQGARLVGAYSSNVAYGQSRIFVAWQRIVFPDGTALDIGAMPGTDAEGEAGFNDKTNNHFVRIFGSALLMSAITAGVTWSQDHSQNNNGNSNRVSAGDALSEALGQELGMTMSEMIRKNRNIAPTLKVRPGYRFNILVVKDVVLTHPYHVGNY